MNYFTIAAALLFSGSVFSNTHSNLSYTLECKFNSQITETVVSLSAVPGQEVLTEVIPERLDLRVLSPQLKVSETAEFMFNGESLTAHLRMQSGFIENGVVTKVRRRSATDFSYTVSGDFVAKYADANVINPLVQFNPRALAVLVLRPYTAGEASDLTVTHSKASCKVTAMPQPSRRNCNFGGGC